MFDFTTFDFFKISNTSNIRFILYPKVLNAVFSQLIRFELLEATFTGLETI